ncbi:MAG: ankyrin repeat domain-containing protein [Pseudomonadota bacterium]
MILKKYIIISRNADPDGFVGAILDKPNGDSTTPLHWAAAKNEFEVVAFLIANGVNPNTQDSSGRTALMEAAREGGTQSASILALGAPGVPDNYKCELELKDRHGMTALFDATLFEQTETAIWLIMHGADINSSNEIDKTVLMMAVEKGNIKLVRYLLDRGVALIQVNKQKLAKKK